MRSLTGPLLCLLDRSLSAGITGSGREVTFIGSDLAPGFGRAAGFGRPEPFVTDLIFEGVFTPLEALATIGLTGVGGETALVEARLGGNGCGGMREAALLAAAFAAGRTGLAVEA